MFETNQITTYIQPKNITQHKNTPYILRNDTSSQSRGVPNMKQDLMQKFMNSYVGKGVHLTIRDGGSRFRVHTIQIMEKMDNSCPIKELKVGDYFFRLLARDENNTEAAILCNWDEQLLQNLLENYTNAKDAGSKEVTMVKGGSSPNNWFVAWRPSHKGKPTQYIQ